MELITALEGAKITLPALEVILLVIVLSACLVFSYNKTGLLAAYLFAYKWGFSLFRGWEQRYLTIYLMFGSIIAVLAVVTMIQSTHGEK